MKATSLACLNDEAHNRTFELIKDNAAAHYSKKIMVNGPSFLGVDWGSEDGQIIRFRQLVKHLERGPETTLIDYGCGYGALIDYLQEVGYEGKYRGFDISAEMIAQAKNLYGGNPKLTFCSDTKDLEPADYTVVSGVFNVRMETPEDDWLCYILKTIEHIRQLSKKGFVFNALSDKTPENMRENDLYYANEAFIADFCRKTFKAEVLAWNDYPLNDFTVFVGL